MLWVQFEAMVAMIFQALNALWNTSLLMGLHTFKDLMET